MGFAVSCKVVVAAFRQCWTFLTHCKQEEAVRFTFRLALIRVWVSFWDAGWGPAKKWISNRWTCKYVYMGRASQRSQEVQKLQAGWTYMAGRACNNWPQKGYVLSCNQQQQQLCTLDKSMQQVLRSSSPVLTQPRKIRSGRFEREWLVVSLCCQHCKSLSWRCNACRTLPYGGKTAMQVVLQLMECEGWIYVSRKHINCSDEEVGIYA